MNNLQDQIDSIRKLAIYASILKSPDEFFHHMNGHTTELSLVLRTFDIAENAETIAKALEMQIPEQSEQKEPCTWCKGNYRFEFNWIDDDGNTITKDNMVIGGIADYCPVCGRPLNQPYTK